MYCHPQILQYEFVESRTFHPFSINGLQKPIYSLHYTCIKSQHKIILVFVFLKSSHPCKIVLLWTQRRAHLLTLSCWYSVISLSPCHRIWFSLSALGSGDGPLVEKKVLSSISSTNARKVNYSQNGPKTFASQTTDSFQGPFVLLLA